VTGDNTESQLGTAMMTSKELTNSPVILDFQNGLAPS
jgi:hypothetical protein